MADKITGLQTPDSYAQNPDETGASEIRATDQIDPATGAPNWVNIGRDAFRTSTDYFDANIRKQLERNISSFRNRHQPGSKYYTDSYKYRSKIFRPKTRATIRRHEAAAAMAFFNTLDTVACLPEDTDDEASVLGAEYGRNWLNYRLENSIPWFFTLIGAYQDAMNQGLVISRQEWLYKTEEETRTVAAYGDDGLVLLDDKGDAVYEDIKVDIPVEDRPDITTLPVENFRFSTAADWRDPVKSSPFLIEIMPMFVGDVKERMTEIQNKTNEPKWNKLEDQEIQDAQSGYYDWDSTRMVREGKRSDPKDETYQLQAFDVVWVHRVIVRHKGKDWLYYTLGTEKMLSEPVLLEEVYLHGRPYKVGFSILETHRNYPSGLPELVQDLQTEANEITNQRLDNVKLVMNKRYRGRRGANVDWAALTRNVPGGVVLMDDVNADIKVEEMNDITGSAYQEQERVDTDFDEIVGNFNSASVQNRRSANDTVGGMAMSMDDSNILTEYQLRVFTESWVEPVLKQLITMAQKYETDERVLKLVGDGVDAATVDELMDTTYNVKVAVGFGATSPHKRVEKLSVGLKTLIEVKPEMQQRLDGDEIAKEILGALGFRDGKRFITEVDGDPMVAQLQQQVEQLTSMLNSNQMDNEAKLQIAQIKEEGQTARTQMELDINTQIDYIGKQIDAEKNDIARGELILQQDALEFKKKEREVELLTDERDRMSNVLMNDQYGIVPAAEG